MTLFGIDQQARVPDWPRMKAAGITFSVSRCVGENGVIDPDYAPNTAGAKSVGIIPGAYFFAAGGSTVEYGKRFFDAVGDPTGKLIWYDWESPNYHPAASYADTVAWFNEKEKHWPGHPICMYGNGPFLRSKLGLSGTKGRELTPWLWLAAYWSSAYPGDGASAWDVGFAGWDGPVGWQYWGTSTVAGATVDRNAFRGSRDRLLLLTDAGPTAGGIAEEVPLGPFPISTTETHVDVIVGRQLYTLDLQPRAKADNVVNAKSPAAYRTGDITYRVAKVPFLGIYELVLVKDTDCSRIEPVKEPVSDCTVELARITELEGQLANAANAEAAHLERYYTAAQAAVPKPEAVP